MKNIIMIVLYVLMSPIHFSKSQDTMAHMLKRLNEGVVSLEITISQSAERSPGVYAGTGFLVDREKGIILTNAHMVQPGSKCLYRMTFASGKQIDAKLKYFDPWHDFAFLQINPQEIPQETKALKLKPNNLIETEEEVFIIGNNGGCDSSFLSGRVASKFDSMGIFPNQSFRIAINNTGGSSGSPVFNMDGEVIGIMHSTNNKYSGYALPIEYVLDSLSQLLKNKTPLRQHTGVLVDYVALDYAEKFLQLPTAEVNAYVKKFPEGRHKILKVISVLKGSPADGVILPGDIILALNGKDIGPYLYEMDKIQDHSVGLLTIDIYRYGERKTLKVGTYDLQAHKIQELVIAAGATFFKISDTLRLQTGAEPGSIFVTKVQEGGSFYNSTIPFIPTVRKMYVNIKRINRQAISSLEDVKKFFSKNRGQHYLSIGYQNFGCYVGYDSSFHFSQSMRQLEVKNINDEPLMTFKFDDKEMDWIKN